MTIVYSTQFCEGMYTSYAIQVLERSMDLLTCTINMKLMYTMLVVCPAIEKQVNYEVL